MGGEDTTTRHRHQQEWPPCPSGLYQEAEAEGLLQVEAAGPGPCLVTSRTDPWVSSRHVTTT